MNVSKKISDYITANGPSSPRDIASDLGVDHLTVRQSLLRMRERGELHRVRYGVYDISGDPAESDGRSVKTAVADGTLVQVGQIVDIHDNLSIHPEMWFFVADDAMAGSVPKHCIVPINMYRGKSPDDAIYLIILNGHYTIRRVHNLPEGRLQVSSDNKSFPSFEFDNLKSSSVQIVGRVML